MLDYWASCSAPSGFVLCSGPKHVEKSQLPLRRSCLFCARNPALLTTPVPRRSWSSIPLRLPTTRVLEGPYHTTQYTAMGVPFEALLPYGICLAVRHHLVLRHAVNPTTNTPTRSSSVLPALVSQRSETFRTAASAPDIPSTSGTDKVRNLVSRDSPMTQKR